MSMIGTGQAYKSAALNGMKRYATLNDKLKADAEVANTKLDAAEKQQNMGMGAAAGAAVGSMIMPGVGTVLGGLVGGLFGSLF